MVLRITVSSPIASTDLIWIKHAFAAHYKVLTLALFIHSAVCLKMSLNSRLGSLRTTSNNAQRPCPEQTQRSGLHPYKMQVTQLTLSIPSPTPLGTATTLVNTTRQPDKPVGHKNLAIILDVSIKTFFQ